MNGEVTRVPELPKGWVWVTLKEIGANDKNAIVDGPFGSNLKVSDYIEDDTGMPVLTTKNLEYGYDKKHLRYISHEKFEQLRRSEVRSGDILVAKIGSCGKTGVYPNNMPSAMIPANLLKMTVNSWIERMYVYYFLNSPVFRGELEEITTATAQPAFNVSKFRSLAFPLCPYAEQLRIVAKIEELFTRLDAGVEALRKIKAQLKRYRQAVLKHAFEGKLTEEWRQAHKHEIEPASVLLDRIKQERQKTAKGKYKELTPLNTSNLSEIPEEWAWCKVNWLCDTQTGPFGTQLHKLDYVTAGVPTIEIGDVHPDRNLGEGTRNFISERKALELKRFAVKNGDVLFSRIGTVGRCTLVPSRCDGWIMSTSIIRVRIISEHLLPKYLLLYFWSPVSQYFTRVTSKGTTRAGTNSKIVGDLPLILPPVKEQLRIVDEIERRFSIADEIEKTVDHSLKQAERLRQSILKRTFEGKLVSQDPNDEPAEKFLERIKAEKARQLAEATSKSKRKTHKNK